MEPDFVQVASADDVGGSGFVRVTVEGRPVLLARLPDDRIVAFGSTCPHLGAPLDGAVQSGMMIECTRHFYAYDLRTGENLFPGDDVDVALPVYEVVQSEGHVWVRAEGLPERDTGTP